MLVALLETIATVGIAFFAATVSDPQDVMDSKYMIELTRILELDFLTTQKGTIIFVSVLLILLLVTKNASQIAVNYYTTRFSYLMDEYFGSMLFNGFLNMPYKWHLSKNTADIVLALEWRVFLGSSFIKSSLTIFTDILVVFFLLMTLLLAEPLISIVMIVVLGLTAFLIHTKTHILQEKMADQCRKYDKSINREVTKGIHGIKDLKISGRIPIFLEYFKKDAYPLAKYRGLQAFYLLLPKGLLECIGFFMITTTVCVIVIFTEPGTTSNISGIITLLAVTAWRVLPAVNRILGGFISIRSILPYTNNQIKYLNEIEKRGPKKIDINGKTSEKYNFKSEIRIDNLSFAYGENESKTVIQDVSFTIKKGQTVGIVGRSGAGKSTVVDILIGLLTPTTGHVLIDGNKLDEPSRYGWMSLIGYVPQSPYIFDGSLAKNIAFGYNESEINRELVHKCCEMAYMNDFLYQLDDGIDTSIGERGVRLSGGEQQRVAIARALYTNPELMIFDEATSSLDTKAEKAIQKTIYSFKRKHTLVIIAHRLSTVIDCDSIIWIEKGKIKLIDTPTKVINKYENVHGKQSNK